GHRQPARTMGAELYAAAASGRRDHRLVRGHPIQRSAARARKQVWTLEVVGMTGEGKASGAAAIDVCGVSMKYGGAEGGGTLAMDEVSFRIASGKFFVLVGPSGCGKSSLLMMMAGLRRPSSGSIHCGGKLMESPDPDRAGVVFQEANLYPWLTAQKNVEFPLMLRNVPAEERSRRAREGLGLVELAGFADRYPHELSGGMKQRVSIARGLVQHPSVLLMDEPFAALDEQTRLTMGDELLRIWERTGQTVVFVTHSLSEAVYLADEV